MPNVCCRGNDLWWPGEGIRYPGIKITNCFVLPDVGPENQTLVLLQSSMRSKARHSPVPFPHPNVSECVSAYIYTYPVPARHTCQ